MPVHPKRSSNHLLPANAEVGPSIDEVSDSDQFLHAAISLKRYYFCLQVPQRQEFVLQNPRVLSD